MHTVAIRLDKDDLQVGTCPHIELTEEKFQAIQAEYKGQDVKAVMIVCRRCTPDWATTVVMSKAKISHDYYSVESADNET